MFKTILAATTAILIAGAVAGPANAGQTLNGLNINGVRANGVKANGFKLNGLFLNGAMTNGHSLESAGSAPGFVITGLELPPQSN